MGLRVRLESGIKFIDKNFILKIFFCRPQQQDHVRNIVVVASLWFVDSIKLGPCWGRMGWKKIVGIKGIKKKGRANATQVSIGTHRPIAFKIRLELYINKLMYKVLSLQYQFIVMLK